jgi:hypothetical protein
VGASFFAAWHFLSQPGQAKLPAAVVDLRNHTTGIGIDDQVLTANGFAYSAPIPATPDPRHLHPGLDFHILYLLREPSRSISLL